MQTLSAVFIITQCFTLISSSCNYIDFGLYAIPESVCVEEDIYITETKATFSVSYKYNCNPSDLTQMEKPDWLCWATGDFLTSKCAFKYCPGTPDGSTSIAVGDLGHNYQGANSYDNLPVTDIQCNQNTNTNCNYVRVKNYDQDPSGLPFNGNIIPIITNQCISKKIFGCNETNYWRVNYKDNQCTQPNSIYFYHIEPSTFPKHTVEQCISITDAPTDIPIAKPLPLCVSNADLRYLNHRYSWLKFDESINSDIFQCETCVGFDAYVHGYTADDGSQFLIIGPTETTASAWTICYVDDNGPTYIFNVNDCQTWFQWDAVEEEFVADNDMIIVECTPEPTLNPTQRTAIPTAIPTSVTLSPTQASLSPTMFPTPVTKTPTGSLNDGPNAMGNDKTSQKTPLNKENEGKENMITEMHLIIAGIVFIISVLVFIGFYMLCKQRKNNNYKSSIGTNSAIVMGENQSVKSVDGEDEEFV